MKISLILIKYFKNILFYNVGICNNYNSVRLLTNQKDERSKKFTQIEGNAKNDKHQIKLVLLHTRTISTVYF